MTKNKIFICFSVFFVCILFSFAFSVNVEALDDKVDVSINEPFVVTQGEPITENSVKQSLYYGNISLSSMLKSITLIDGSSHVSIGNLNSIVFNDSETYKELTLRIVYTIPGTTVSETKDVPFFVKKNNKPIISVPHIYLSEDEMNDMTTDSISSLILQKVVIKDPEGRTDLNAKIENMPTTLFPGTTSMIQVSVDDYNITVNVPAYLTIIANTDDAITETLKDAKIRIIDKTNYPFYRDDICRVKQNGVNGYLVKRANDGYFYYLNNEHNFLTQDRKEGGTKYSVAAGPAVSLQKYTALGDYGYYIALPVSKWLANADCVSMITSCMANTGSEYIQLWTFDENDIYTIRKQLVAGTYDKHFYSNHFANGYCKLGDKTPNTMGSTVSTKELDNGLTWRISNDILYIEKNTNVKQTSTYAIPNYAIDTSVDGDIKKTTAPWAKYTFSKVVIDNKVTKIGDYAFYGLTCIEQCPEIPNNCTYIGEHAFENCVNMSGELKTKSVAIIKQSAFKNCLELKGNLSLGAGALMQIEDEAFYNCKFKGSLSIPSSVISIGNYAFAYCNNFSGNLSFSANLRTIGEGAFMNCSGFDGDLYMNCAVTEIQPFTFANCTGFNGNIVLPNNVTVIKEYAFLNCQNISGEITLPEHLATICIGAFKNCQSLKTTLTINSELHEIGPEAFANCINITTINNKRANEELYIGGHAFYVEGGIVNTTIMNQNNPVFRRYPFLADGREIPKY